ncbi:MAG: OmpH family outer membrane protein [Rhodospirillales bacterium]|nr:OmpH family outer membrane protein [Rhodospirillales bacterium]
MLHTRLPVTALLALLAFAAPAAAQQQQWFVPGHPAPAHGPVRPAAAPGAPGAEAGPAAIPLELKLPPAPPVPAVPRGLMPPAAVIGVLSVPDVLQQSTAYQQADKVIAERRQHLNDDAQKEQAALRTLSQQFAAERAKMTPAQVRAKEAELRDRIAASRRKFADRGRIIQEQGQFALAQIQRTLQEVVQRVASARGMNLVLQRQAVAVNIPEFDLTAQVIAVLNKALPKVTIPPEGVEPLKIKPGAPAHPAAAAKPKKVPH